jgi:hypothetical protein
MDKLNTPHASPAAGATPASALNSTRTQPLVSHGASMWEKPNSSRKVWPVAVIALTVAAGVAGLEYSTRNDETPALVAHASTSDPYASRMEAMEASPPSAGPTESQRSVAIQPPSTPVVATPAAPSPKSEPPSLHKPQSVEPSSMRETARPAARNESRNESRSESRNETRSESITPPQPVIEPQKSLPVPPIEPSLSTLPVPAPMVVVPTPEPSPSASAAGE